MSWLENVNTELVIKTGDGKKYSPNYLNANKTKEYNVAVFEFKELAGSLVYRGQPKGRRYSIELYFQGDNHLETAKAFENSADNPKAWTISHPYYGDMVVQPVGLDFDNSADNVTRISGGIIETLNADGTTPSISPEDKITQDKDSLDKASASGYAQDVIAVAADRISVGKSTGSMFDGVSAKISDATDLSDYYNAYNEVNTTINKAAFDTYELMRQVQTVANMPANFQDTLEMRLEMFKLQIDQLNNGTASIIRAADKQLYQAMMAASISALVLASVTNPGAYYSTRTTVLSTIDTIYNYHKTFLTKLDVLQSTTGTGTNVFMPNPAAIIPLSQLVGFAVSNLLTIANNAKQERTIILEEDSDLIQLSRRFYGLQPDDSTITTFKESNNIGMSELFEIKKGRKIIYYV